MKKSKSTNRRRKPTDASRRKTSVIPPPETARRRKTSMPIVGIGASAGGLEAIEQFLSHVPSKSGVAYVVVQHLDPTRKGMLVELLQRSTPMPIVQIKDRLKIKPDHVYVIPPNKDLSLLRGRLHLQRPAARRGMRLPIDFFFRSLAADLREHSVVVILSGMGADGTGGGKSIKEMSGAVFVQSPASAKFDSMPRMAIEAGLADVVAPADELPAKVMAYLRHVPRFAPTLQSKTETDLNAVEKIIVLLRERTDHDFSLYKRNTIFRRIERRMGLHQFTGTSHYLRFLRENPAEVDLLFKELLIGVTSFFRDPAVWDQLLEKVLPQYLAACPQSGVVRAWVAGCSSGEEAYSLAMVFKEAMQRLKTPRKLLFKIFATDLDKDAIEKARAGNYSADIAADVTEKRLNRFFSKEEHGGFSVKREIREMVTFAPQNLAMHPPFTKLDFVTCRNVLIYFDAELQKKLISLFHYSLNPGGILVLGSSETVGQRNDLFAPLPGKVRIYRKADDVRRTKMTEFPSSFTPARHELANVPPSPVRSEIAPPNLQSLSEQLLLQRYSPSAVLVTKQGDILYVNGKIGKYLEPAAGKANWNVFAMARGGVSEALNEGFHKAVRQKKTITFSNVIVSDGQPGQRVDITIEPIVNPEALRGMVILIFQNAHHLEPNLVSGRKTGGRRDARLASVSNELKQAHRELRAARDEMQLSQEELRSTNEELQSMNEELQSTNEELTTSKEEMQSMNEELQTVNHELQSKVDELSHTSNDMKNLLDSTDIATLFLDNCLNVRRFTPRTSGVIKLIPGDVGRPITDIVSTLDYPGLADDAEVVLKTLSSKEKQVSARGGRWFLVRTMPYRTQENIIDGLVMTFSDITASKKLEEELRKVQSSLEGRLRRQKR